MKADSFTAEQAAVEQLSRATLDVVRSYNQERGQLAVLVSNQDRLQGKAPLTRARETPCEAPSTKTSGSEHPTLAAGNAAPEEVYPPTSESPSSSNSMTGRTTSGGVRSAGDDAHGVELRRNTITKRSVLPTIGPL
jgi:hypothetical protein